MQIMVIFSFEIILNTWHYYFTNIYAEMRGVLRFEVVFLNASTLLHCSNKIVLMLPLLSLLFLILLIITFKDGEFTLWVKTAQDSQPSNGGKAVLVIYGDRGRSPDIDLHAPSSTAKLFEPGKDDEFQVTIRLFFFFNCKSQRTIFSLVLFSGYSV